MSSTYWTSLDLSRNSLSTIQLSFTQPCVQRRGSRLLAAAACTEGRVRKHGSSSKREPIPRLEAKGSHCRYGYEGAVRCCSLLDGPITVALVPFVGRVSVCGPVAASGDTPLTCSVLCDGQGGEVSRAFAPAENTCKKLTFAELSRKPVFWVRCHLATPPCVRNPLSLGVPRLCPRRQESAVEACHDSEHSLLSKPYSAYL